MTPSRRSGRPVWNSDPRSGLELDVSESSEQRWWVEGDVGLGRVTDWVACGFCKKVPLKLHGSEQQKHCSSVSCRGGSMPSSIWSTICVVGVPWPAAASLPAPALSLLGILRVSLCAHVSLPIAGFGPPAPSVTSSELEDVSQDLVSE